VATAYGLLLVVHIASIALAFGAMAAYPWILRSVRREAPGSTAALVRAGRRFGDAVVAPAATLTLVTGALLATIGGYWSEVWVSLSLSLLVYVLTLHGAFVVPAQGRLEGLAVGLHDPMSADRPGSSAEYDVVARRLTIASHLSSTGILIALALMVLKPS
jgi:hypothetical protein